ncbi:MAG TPA: TonB family protein [Geobacteraceae bacterium]|nr:TonB family protein [Geobacteraceae bacterium]
MNDQYIEKTFIYLVVLSIIIHVAVYYLFDFLPDIKSKIKPEPYMVELEDLPQLNNVKPSPDKGVNRKSDKRIRVKKEIAPKGRMPVDHVSPQIAKIAPITPLQPQNKRTESGALPESGKEVLRKVPRGKDLLVNQNKNLPELAKLYPNANRLSSIEENYRKKYENEVEEGETKFLNSDDIQFGSFLRRFETAVYGVWRYPSDAARLGIEGITPVKITFNRKGEIDNVQLLESSGSSILDNEVFRTLRLIGPIGGFPKGYDKDKFSLVAFFQYGIIRGVSRGVLR